MPSMWRQELHFTTRDASSITGVALSKDARFLAIAYGVCVDIWDLKNTHNAPLAQYNPDSMIHPISFLTWSTECHRLAVCFEGGLVCVIALKIGEELSSLAVGFRLKSGEAQQGNVRVLAAFLRDDILAVAMGEDVEIRCFLEDGSDPRWDLKSKLTPSASCTGNNLPTGNIQSIHSIPEDCILVSYENQAANVWGFEQSVEGFLTCAHKFTTTLPGVINDVSKARGTILVAAAGTYQVLVLGSTTAQSIFIPHDPITGYPQTISCARYVSEDVIIGAGTSQLILWNAELGNRLQNLPIQNQEGGPVTHHICTAYSREEDSGWIVTAHDGGKIICWKTIDTQ
ncbi:WD40-repeat-containing domain protein [Lentinula raphanica]|nr:WD40-repeat-containing domain protein [Lentinula raphanica]